MRLKEEQLAKCARSSHRESSSLNWSRGVIRMMQFFGWLTLFGAFVGSLGFTWFFGTVAVATVQGMHREVNLMGIAATGGILFVGILATLFIFVVCAAATALVDLREQRWRDESDQMLRMRLGEPALIPGDRDKEQDESMRNRIYEEPTSRSGLRYPASRRRQHRVLGRLISW